ncbi:bacteriocin [Streptococcus pantholopis]|uniref:Competence protein n=1 Tax=Streptococcus pantholopis TaxID=1811193 RepID=A0A172Q626_9STRE|nr:bacteriocin [Streptococcus pantholopis]AND78900.1 competence protein [Streptococcus pantholopis]
MKQSKKFKELKQHELAQTVGGTGQHFLMAGPFDWLKRTHKLSKHA